LSAELISPAWMENCPSWSNRSNLLWSKLILLFWLSSLLLHGQALTTEPLITSINNATIPILILFLFILSSPHYEMDWLYFGSKDKCCVISGLECVKDSVTFDASMDNQDVDVVKSGELESKIVESSKRTSNPCSIAIRWGLGKGSKRCKN